jgi:2-isopropylmalate synthase
LGIIQVGVTTGINTREIYRTSQLLCSLTGMEVQANKAIVGKNAFAHEAGIHQDGVLKEAGTYEIMTPESVGVPTNRIVLGKHSGRHGLAARYRELGYQLSEADLARAYMLFTKLADRKKTIYDEDLIVIVTDGIQHVPAVYSLKHFHIVGTSDANSTVTLSLEKDGAMYTESATGDGPVDATVRAVNRIAGCESRVSTYTARAVTEGSEAVGEVMIQVEIEGRSVVGRAASTDLNIAAARAYLDAINKAVWLKAPERTGQAQTS